MLSLLVVEDDQDIAVSLKSAFEDLGHAVEATDSAEKGLEYLRKQVFDVVFTDLKLGGMDGVQLAARVRDQFPSVTSVVITAQGSVDSAIQAMKCGAFDYLCKPLNLDRLEHLLDKVQRFRTISDENAQLRARPDILTAPLAFPTRNVRMRKVLDIASRVAVRYSTVLITGESGTGKTLLAKMMHDGSPRRTAPFSVVNCATLSENLLESELFGHARGSFTGAIRDKVGRLQVADTGTIFLDEIGEISPGLQTKLLRFLQDREFERVGDTRTIKVDVRIIAATNKDLEKEVLEGRFREDLYYRLNVIELSMPSLRDRQEDLPKLIETLLAEACTSVGRNGKRLSEDACRVLLGYRWPGNIRELKNALERAVILCASDEIQVDDLSDRVLGAVRLQGA